MSETPPAYAPPADKAILEAEPPTVYRMIHLAHLSDIHITTPALEWQRADWFNKRWAGWINFRWLGRGYRFRRADEVLAALMRDLAERRPHHVIFSGDATAMGFEGEMKKAAEMLGVGVAGALPGLAVPGNHDYYTVPSAASGLFEKHFGPWQTGQRVGNAAYPFAQQVGECFVIGLNTSSGNRLAWDASGRVLDDQLERLRQLLRQLPAGPRILVTHYPVCLQSGRREHLWHGLRNMPDVVEAAAAGGVQLWLHGHRHHAYEFEKSAHAPFPIICAGSATQTGLWSYADYRIDGGKLQALRRVYDLASGRFRDGPTFEFKLTG